MIGLRSTSRNYSTSDKIKQLENTVPESWKKVAQKELKDDPISSIFRETPEVLYSNFIFFTIFCNTTTGNYCETNLWRCK